MYIMSGCRALRIPIVSSVLLLFLSSACSVSINRLKSERINSKSIYVMDPICESRIQMTRDAFVVDFNELRMLDSLTNSTMHRRLDPYLMGYDRSRRLFHNTTKMFLDSALKRYRAPHGQFFIKNRKFDVPDSIEFVLIPYTIWTRTKEDFEKCNRYVTRGYSRTVTCTWTLSEMYLFLFDNKTGYLVYFKARWWAKGGWYSDGIALPFYKRIDRSFYMVSRPLLKRLSSSY
jgi:hypothetical protein